MRILSGMRVCWDFGRPRHSMCATSRLRGLRFENCRIMNYMIQFRSLFISLEHVHCPLVVTRVVIKPWVVPKTTYPRVIHGYPYDPNFTMDGKENDIINGSHFLVFLHNG